MNYSHSERFGYKKKHDANGILNQTEIEGLNDDYLPSQDSGIFGKKREL